MSNNSISASSADRHPTSPLISNVRWLDLKREYPMFDAEYFRSKFDLQRKKAGGSHTVEIRLQNGECYHAESLISIEDNHVLFRVYPPIEEASDQSIKLELLIIPYESIVRILITRNKPKKIGKIGYKYKDK